MATKAVFLDYATMGPGLDTYPLTAIFPELEIFDATAADEVATRIKDAEFVFGNKIRLYDELFDEAPQLRFIGLTATGTDNVDLAAAARRDVAVCNIRGYCTRSVTEHVFGLMLMLTHNLHRYAGDVRRGDWQRAQDFCMLTHPIRELSTMTLGIVGYGELGKSVAGKAREFDMNVIVSARPGAQAAGDGRVAFADLLEHSDIISLHCPLTDATRNLFGEKEFAAMQSSAMLINTARGGLVDSAALVDALATGQIAGAAVDVLPTEPPVDGDPLIDYRGDNLIVTPHIAWGTDRSRQDALVELAKNVAAFLQGRKRNRVV